MDRAAPRRRRAPRRPLRRHRRAHRLDGRAARGLRRAQRPRARTSPAPRCRSARSSGWRRRTGSSRAARPSSSPAGTCARCGPRGTPPGTCASTAPRGASCSPATTCCRRISPNIAVHSQQIANPLADYLASLGTVEHLECDEVLPGPRVAVLGARGPGGASSARTTGRGSTRSSPRWPPTSGLTCWELTLRLTWSRPARDCPRRSSSARPPARRSRTSCSWRARARVVRTPGRPARFALAPAPAARSAGRRRGQLRTRRRKLRSPIQRNTAQNPHEHRVDDVEVHVRHVRERRAHPLVDVDQRVDQHDRLEPVPRADARRARAASTGSRCRRGT